MWCCVDSKARRVALCSHCLRSAILKLDNAIVTKVEQRADHSCHDIIFVMLCYGCGGVTMPSMFVCGCELIEEDGEVKTRFVNLTGHIVDGKDGRTEQWEENAWLKVLSVIYRILLIPGADRKSRCWNSWNDTTRKTATRGYWYISPRYTVWSRRCCQSWCTLKKSIQTRTTDTQAKPDFGNEALLLKKPVQRHAISKNGPKEEPYNVLKPTW